MKSKITRFIQQQKKKKVTQWCVIHSEARVLWKSGEVGQHKLDRQQRLSVWVRFDLA